jgi:glycosyltransferase involved in cell wall biosynthesis
MRLSIIVPMYNVANYVTRCIESLENQDVDKSTYEIICINDGSPDDCRTIVEGLQKKYPNIVLLNQENQGVSMARNNGIARAKGKYILPIDPDDYVLPQTFGKLIARAENQALDVLYLGFEIFNAAGTSSWQTDYSVQEDTIYSGVEGYFAARGKAVNDPDRSWAILYRRDLLNKFQITYPKNVPYLEDGLFLAKVFAVAQKVGFSNKKFYQRTTRMGSATNSKLFYSEVANQGFIYAIVDIFDFSERNNLNLKQKLIINHVAAKFIILALSPSCSSFNVKEFNAVFKTISPFLKKVNTINIRYNYKRMIKILKINKFLFFSTFRIIK